MRTQITHTGSGDAESVLFVIPSDFTLVHPVLQAAQGFAHKHGITDTSKMTVVLRELLINAIFHGNRNDRDLDVRCRIEYVGSQTLRIVIEDQGKGFDYVGMETKLPDDPRHIRNRGYVLITNTCKALEFNECGNQVTVLVEARDASRNTEQ